MNAKGHNPYSLPNTGHWDQRYRWMAGCCCLFSVLLVCLFFPENLVASPYLVFGVLVTLGYFGLVDWRYRSQLSSGPRQFASQLFIAALLIRVLATLLLYYFYQWQTGMAFEFNAVDSKFYHFNGALVADRFHQMDFNFPAYLPDMGFSDQGYNLYLGLVYTFFGKSLLAARLVNAIFSAATVPLIYQLGRSCTGNENSARLAGAMALFLPNFLLYQGTHLKEPVMVFMVTAALYLSVAFFTQRNRLLTALLLLAVFFGLFMFRTVLALTAVAAFAGYGLSIRDHQRKIPHLLAATALLLAFLYLILNSPVGAEMKEYAARYAGNQSDNMEFRATREGGNKFALLAGAPLFLSIILITPFPSLVYVPEQDLLWMFISANFIRNLYGLFVIAGILFLIRKNFSRSALLLYFLAGYLLVLANSGFAISERFHLPVVPVLLVLAAEGMSRFGRQLKRYYPWYLALLCLLVLGWNYIKLAGRIH